MSSMTMPSDIPASITFVVTLLTAPLERAYSPSTMHILRSTLTRSLFNSVASTKTPTTPSTPSTPSLYSQPSPPSSASSNSNSFSAVAYASIPYSRASQNKWTLTLSLTSVPIPPPALLTACIASGIKWQRWYLHLGGKPVTFAVSEEAVIAYFPLLNNMVPLWQKPRPSVGTHVKARLMQKEMGKGKESGGINRRWNPPMISSPLAQSAKWQNPNEIPTSPPKSSMWTAVTPEELWRPDSPGRDEVWSDEEDEWDEEERWGGEQDQWGQSEVHEEEEHSDCLKVEGVRFQIIPPLQC